MNPSVHFDSLVRAAVSSKRSCTQKLARSLIYLPFYDHLYSSHQPPQDRFLGISSLSLEVSDKPRG